MGYPHFDPAGTLPLIPHVYFLFEINGARDANAVVEITFQQSPPQASRAEIIVCELTHK
jgi:hypothetical protein